MAFPFRVGQWVKLAVAQPSGGIKMQRAIFMPERQPVFNADGTVKVDDQGQPVSVLIETVHLVNDSGETFQIVPSAGLTLEAITDVAELPASRRAHLPDGYNPAARR